MQLGGEVVDVVFGDGEGGDVDFFGVGDEAFFAAKGFGDEFHRLAAELEGLLDDGGDDGAGFDAVEGGLVFVEADDLDFADFVGFLDGFEDGGAVVGPEADQAGDVGIFDERVLDVGFGADGVGVIGADVEDLDGGALEGFCRCPGSGRGRSGRRASRRRA